MDPFHGNIIIYIGLRKLTFELRVLTPITSRELSKRDVRRKDPIEKTSGWIPTDSCRLTYSLQAIRGHLLQQR